MPATTPAQVAIKPSVCEFYKFETQHGAAAANRLLFGWLSNDTLRDQLYADMVEKCAVLHFSSNASERNNAQDDKRDFDWIDGPRNYYQPAVLMVHPEHIEVALTQSNSLHGTETAAQTEANLWFSSSPFQGLGGFNMLGTDIPGLHDPQRAFALNFLDSTNKRISTQQYDALSTLAFKAGSLVALKSHEFDLKALAENVAMRYLVMTFGFAQKDVALIEMTTRAIGRGLQYQMMARHFVFEPATMPECRAALAQLGKRATEIMQFYIDGFPLTRLDQLEKDEIEADRERMRRYDFQINASGAQNKVLKDFVPIIQAMATTNDPHFGLVEKGLIVAGLIGGAVTNIQNAICVCMAQFFKQKPEELSAFRKAAIDERAHNRDAQWIADSLLLDRIKEALRVNPPATFIPRRANRQITELACSKQTVCPGAAGKDDIVLPSNTIEKNTLILIGMGGASWIAEDAKKTNRFRNEVKTQKLASRSIAADDSAATPSCPFSKIFGGAPKVTKQSPADPKRWEYTHSCPGMMMSMHVIAYTVRQLLVLPSLAQRINPDEGKPYGLEKRWGFQSTWYPLSYQRERLLVQTPLQTVLPVLSPVDFHSQALRRVIAHGAPFIEKVIYDSKLVHFASFMFLENDSKLVLFTMYDGDFDTYIGLFAKEFGHLFDRFFSHIAISPPMPIQDHPFEFVQYLKQFARPPVEGYYFSAYPEVTSNKIVQQFTPQFDFNLIRGGQ